MPAMLYSMPTWLLGLLVVGGFIAFGVTGTFFTMGWIHARWHSEHEVVGVVVTSITVLYAVLLAMIAVAAWQDYAALNNQVREEAAIAGNIYRDVEGFPEPTRSDVRMLIREYVDVVARDEWPLMTKGLQPTATNDIAANLLIAVSRFKPKDLGESDTHSEVFAQLNRLFELRRLRQESVTIGLQPVLYVVLLLGAMIDMAALWLLTARERRLGILLAVANATMLGLMVFLVIALDHPLMGEVSIQPTIFTVVGRRMDALQGTLRRDEPAPSTESTPASK